LGNRTRGRKFLLQCRYAARANGLSLAENMVAMSAPERVRDADTRDWIRELGSVTAHNLEEIQAKIVPALQNWTLDRLTELTRLILEQAVAEVVYMDTPAPVAIQEAVRLAQEFEDPKTGSFVNGVLDRILTGK
jgi:transcription antitermination factor NusB